jgi:uncharacterized protein
MVCFSIEGAVGNHNHPLRVNVGFLLNQTAGYVRIMDFDEEKLTLGADLELRNLRGALSFDRTPQGIVVSGTLTSNTPAECARCLSAFLLPLSAPFQDLFVYPPPNLSDPLLAVGEDAMLDLEPLVREYMILDYPLQPICRPDCKGLCPVCGNDLNASSCSHPQSEEESGELSAQLHRILDTKTRPPDEGR